MTSHIRKLDRLAWTPGGAANAQAPWSTAWSFSHQFDANGCLTRRAMVIVSATTGSSTDTSPPAPRGRWSSLRLLLTVASQMNWHMSRIAIEDPYLNLPLAEPIDIQMPPHVPPSVKRLRCVLPGMPGANGLWYAELKRVLAILGFQPTTVDKGVFVCAPNKKPFAWAWTHVGQLVVFSREKSYVNTVINTMNREWPDGQIRRDEDMELQHCKLESKDGAFTLLPMNHINRLAHAYPEHKKFTAVTCPIPTMGTYPAGGDVNMSSDKLYRYRKLRSALGFLATTSRPDLTWAVGTLPQGRASQLPKSHWYRALYILSHLKASSCVALALPPSQLPPAAPPFNPLVGYCVGTSKNQAFSQSPYAARIELGEDSFKVGYVVLCYGALVEWHAHQEARAKKVKHAEALAQLDAIVGITTIQRFLEEIGARIPGDTILFSNHSGPNHSDEAPSSWPAPPQRAHAAVRQSLREGRAVLVRPGAQPAALFTSAPAVGHDHGVHCARLGIPQPDQFARWVPPSHIGLEPN